MTRYLPALTIFLGSFLLFGVQPLLGRTLLPSFGGTAAVWTVCLAAYQTLLLAGYFYAHVVSSRPRSVQRALHTGLLALAVLWTAAFAFFRPELKAHIGNSSMPALEVLFCVMVFAGLPYVLLSAGSTLVQAWLSKAEDGGRRPEDGHAQPAGTVQSSVLGSRSSDSRSIYRLYAVSNLGSFCGLLAYPFLLEPYLSLTAQWWGFAACLAAYAALLSVVARQPDAPSSDLRPPPSDLRPPSSPSSALCPPSSPSSSWLWFALPCLSVFLLNAVTAHLTMDVMALPLLWVALLGAFLLSYVIGFSGVAERHLGVWCVGAAGFAAAAAWGADKGGSLPHFAINLVAGGGLCLVGGVFLHGLLYRIRPESSRLTRYYLNGAAGGAAGGLMASLVAPLVFTGVTEYPVAIVLVTVAAAAYAATEWRTGSRRMAWVCAAGVAVAAGMLVWGAVVEADTKGRTIICQRRGFYGVVTVTEMPASAMGGSSKGVVREFIHGGTVHGMQALIPGKERMTTTYYTDTGGGFAVVNHPAYKAGRPIRVGLVGSGIGVMLGYCRTNDFYRCFEISPEVAAVARDPKLFTFYSGAPGKVEMVLGDARKALEAEAAKGEELYDVLVIDAFTGDNQPYHIFTREAFALYFSRLKRDGLLAVNISNWHLELMPFAKAVSGAFDCSALGLSADKDLERLTFGSLYAVYGREPCDLTFPKGLHIVDFNSVPDVALPTDEKGSFTRYVTW